MQYNFPSLKLYIIGLSVLLIIFFFAWFPSAQVDLIVASEPLLADFEVKLNANIAEVLFNVDSLPVKIIDSIEVFSPEVYRQVGSLIGENGPQMVIIKNADLQKLVEFKIKSILDSRLSAGGEGNERQVFKFRPEKWNIAPVNDFSLGQAVARVSVNEEVIGVYDFEKLKQEIKYKNKNLAEEILKKISTVKNANIKIKPFFYQRTPLLPERIFFSVSPAGI